MMGLGKTSPRAYLPLLFFEIGLPGGQRLRSLHSGCSCGGQSEADDSLGSGRHQLLSLEHPAG